MSGEGSATAAHIATDTLWHHADFIKLFVGQTVSRFGSSLSRLAVPLIAAVTLNATPAEMGLLASVEELPALLVGLFSGVWVDRYRRRNWMILADMGRAVLFATVPLAAWLGVLSMAQLYTVAFLAGVLTIFFDVANRSYLPAVIGREHLVEGNSKLELGDSINSVAGPSLAGLVIQAVTAPIAVVLDALSYLVSAVCVILIRRVEAPVEQDPAPMLAQMRAGLSLVLSSPLLRAFAGCVATSNFMSNIFFALYILFGTRELGLDAATLGLVYGIGASGSLVGAVIGPRLAERVGVGSAIAAGAILGSIEVVPVVFATPATGAVLLVLSSLLGNLGWVVYSINAVSVRQAVTPMAMQGRMNATFTFMVAGMLPLGSLVGGALGQVLGLREAITLAAIGSSLSFLWVFLSPVRGLESIPMPEDR